NNYQVRAGDTCSSMAGASSNYFYQLNTGINCNNLQVGQTVCLPYGSNYATLNGYYSGCQNYVTKAGDSCANLASQSGVPINQFYNLNGYLNCNNLQAGQSVCLPTGTAGTSMSGYSSGNRCYGRQYTIQNGDTCWSVAQRFGTSVEQLQTCTALNCNNLQPGQVISY
ncbi:Peptidoglycan-binding, partial [Brachionus plicatilis]